MSDDAVKFPDAPDRGAQIVIVHGMGQQQTSESLLEWAEPLLKRMDWYSAHPVGRPDHHEPVLEDHGRVLEGVIAVGADVDHRVEAEPPPPAAAEDDPGLDDRQPEPSKVLFTEAVLESPAPPVEIAGTVPFVDLQGTGHVLDFRITEARWSEAFRPLTRSQIFTWGMRFLFRAYWKLTVYFARLFWVTSGVIPYVGHLLAAVAIAGFGLIMVALTIVSLLFLLAAGPLLLLPFAKKVLQPVVDVLVAFVGDVPVWTEHPAQAEALRRVLETQLADARRQADAAGQKVPTKVVVIAHSEGAAVSAETICGLGGTDAAHRVDLLVTVGAAVTLLGRPHWTTHTLSAVELKEQGREKVLNLVRSWASMEGRPRWMNFWATWDVVPSGPISTGPTAREKRWLASYASSDLAPADAGWLGPEEHPVHNSSSIFADHGGYSSNITQVIDPIVRAILDAEPAQGTRAREAEDVRTARRVHAVKDLAVNRLLVAVIAAMLLFVPGIVERLGSVVDAVYGWARGIIVGIHPIDLGTGLFAWFFHTSGVHYLIAVAGFASLLLWLSSFLFQQAITGIDDTAPSVAPIPRLWIWGLVYRSALSLLAGVCLIAWGIPIQPELAGLIIGGAVIAVGVVIAAPFLGHLPSIIRSNPAP